MALTLKCGRGLARCVELRRVMMQVADAFKKMPDGAEKAGLAMKLFGKSGADLIPLLNEGADGLTKA